MQKAEELGGAEEQGSKGCQAWPAREARIRGLTPLHQVSPGEAAKRQRWEAGREGSGPGVCSAYLGPQGLVALPLGKGAAPYRLPNMCALHST